MTDIKSPRCKCGENMVCVDGHYICNKYYTHIRMGIEEQQEMLEALSGGEQDEEE